MPTQLTDQRQPIPATLREKLLALGADPKTLDQLTEQIGLHHELITPKIEPEIKPDTDMN